MEETSANATLTKSVIKENVSGMAQNIAEVALDAALDESLLREIPVVSLIVKAFGIGRGIRDRLFLKKVMLFLSEAGRISPADREGFAKRLSDEPRLAENCGEAAFLLLDKLAQMSKARFMGYAFRRFVQGGIDEVILNRIYAALEFLPFWQLIELPEFYFERGLGNLGQSEAASYQKLWLVEIYYGDKDKRLHHDFRTGRSAYEVYHQPFYRRTDIGLSVAEVIRDYLNEPE
ncbi:MAG TPA: hypothetical protein VNP98_03980 [Chthoniobacterales bacterium]|nr:hypothetical protein [Chthoniobacterales bacterium]